ncbi:MAG: hypothetical protein JHD16_03865 [Solirubrobacteraceae bacterium]|nr:hypothetical protein [Solirubrobacteraceae bacterium]
MEPFGVVVIGVLVVSVIAALVIARNPPSWDDIGGQSSIGPTDAEAEPPSRHDDEADLRALVAEKRARRLAAGGNAVASDAFAAGAGAKDLPPANHPHRVAWGHMESEVVEEARALVARRRARLERGGKPVPDEHEELTRLLGPPHV